LPKVELSVVVPAYREGARIYDNLQVLLGELDRTRLDYEVIVVSDGNTDLTAAEARRVGSSRVKVLEYNVNMGKGFALGQGVRRAAGDLVTFIDADMELNPREIGNFLDILKSGGHDMVVGSKRHPQSRVRYPPLRQLQSMVYQLLVRVLFDLNVRDTQTGLKLFRRQVLADVVPLLAVKRFAFDLELLVVAHQLGYRKIAEAPIELDFQFNSTVRPWTAYKILWDTAAIFYRLHVTRYYQRRRRELAASTDAQLDVTGETRIAN
jgi:glycosyltransferase involved in cell wall biosynthesis